MEGENVTTLLRAWGEGDPSAEEKLWALVYAELHRMAAYYLNGERCGHAMQTTELVHEAYLRLVDQSTIHFEDRVHFLAIAARIMRRILVDHARSRRAVKRGGGLASTRFNDALTIATEAEPVILAINDALVDLQRVDEFKASLVELRFFGGLSNTEVGEVLGCSEITVRRHWQVAKGWLRKEIRASHHET
jgi:RNA polymerase sigma-70 factor (ECF subfamily)